MAPSEIRQEQTKRQGQQRQNYIYFWIPQMFEPRGHQRLLCWASWAAGATPWAAAPIARCPPTQGPFFSLSNNKPRAPQELSSWGTPGARWSRLQPRHLETSPTQGVVGPPDRCRRVCGSSPNPQGWGRRGARDVGTISAQDRGCHPGGREPGVVPLLRPAVASHQPGQCSGKQSPLFGEQQDRVSPPGLPVGAGAVQSHGRRELTGQVARYRRSGCQHHFTSPDSFNINIYLNYKTPRPATYSAARLQLSGMMVTAPTDGRLVRA